MFSLKDMDEGINSQHLSHVFDRFFRAPNSRSTSGAGLGLAIAKEIVLAHGGTIDVISGNEVDKVGRFYSHDSANHGVHGIYRE